MRNPPQFAARKSVIWQRAVGILFGGKDYEK